MGASTTASFLATLAVHATLWFAAAWGLSRALRSAVWRARLWRGAALGGVLSAGLALALDTTRLEWSWAPAAAPLPARAAWNETAAEGAPIVLTGTPPAATPAPVARRESPAAVAWSWSEVAVGLWALGALVALARLGFDRRRLTRALARRRPLRDTTWGADLRELSIRAGLARAPRLSVAEGLSSPLALAHGEVVVPARALRELARDEQRALLAHELAHLARRDPHWLAVLGVVERVFWFQPLLRAASRRASAAAELCCDEAAARWTGAGLALARCLAHVAGWVGARAPERVAVAMAARGSALVERVERLLEPQRARTFEGVACATLALTLLAALACSGPTAREAEETEPEDAELLRQQIELIRQRIDPEGKLDLGIELVGGNRIEISLPPERIAELRREAEQREQLETLRALGYVEVPQEQSKPASDDPSDALRSLGYVQDEREHLDETQELRGVGPNSLDEAVVRRLKERLAVMAGFDDAFLESVIDRLDDCPEAGIAFHLPSREGGYANSPQVPREHVFELQSDGSIWCGDMRLVAAGVHSDRLLTFHLSEIARCTRAGGPDALPGGRLDVVLRDGVPFTALQRVLEQGGRSTITLAHYRIVRMDGARFAGAFEYSLPTEEDLERNAQRERLNVRVEVVEGEQETRSVLCSIQGPQGRSQVRWSGEAPSELRERLLRTVGANHEVSVVIDALPGTIYGDVRALLDVVLEAGFDDIQFVGRREER